MNRFYLFDVVVPWVVIVWIVFGVYWWGFFRKH